MTGQETDSEWLHATLEKRVPDARTRQALSMLFRVWWEKPRTEEPWNVEKETCDRLKLILEHWSESCPDLFPEPTKRVSVKEQIAVFFFDVWQHLIYLEEFQGLGLGSMVQSIMHSRLVCNILNQRFHYLHSFNVLRDHKTGQIVIPIQEHIQNAPSFPSGTWVCARTCEDRLNDESFTKALREYARRLLAEPSGGLKTIWTTFQTALEANAKAERIAPNQLNALATLFTSGTLAMLRAWRPVNGMAVQTPNRRDDDLTQEVALAFLDRIKMARPRRVTDTDPIAVCIRWFGEHNLRDSIPKTGPGAADITTAVDRTLHRLFALSIFERACFIKLVQEKESLANLLDRACAPDTTLEKLYALTYFHVGRLTYHSLSPAADRIDLDPRSSSARARLLSSWLARKVATDKKSVERLPSDALQNGLGKLARACLCLNLGGSKESAGHALRKFKEWELRNAALQASTEQTEDTGHQVVSTPWARDDQCNFLAPIYEPLLLSQTEPVESALGDATAASQALTAKDAKVEPPSNLAGFSFAVHCTSPIGEIGKQKPDLECYRVDVIREDPAVWRSYRESELAIRRTLQLDLLFAPAELLAIDEERKKRSDEFRAAMRGYTIKLAHELGYAIQPLGELVRIPKRIESRLLDLARHPAFSNADTSSYKEATALSDHELQVIISEIYNDMNAFDSESLTADKAESLSDFWEKLRRKRDSGQRVYENDVRWISSRFESTLSIADEIITTVLMTAMGQPEMDTKDKKRVAVRYSAKRMMNDFLWDESKKRSGRYELLNCNWDSLSDAECFLPVRSFRYLILPELARNAARHIKRNDSIQMEAHFESDQRHVDFPILVLMVSNSLKGKPQRAYGAGQAFISDLLRANLGLSRDEAVDRFLCRPIIADLHPNSIYRVELRFPTFEYFSACNGVGSQEL
jgi:hypothetical protein